MYIGIEIAMHMVLGSIDYSFGYSLDMNTCSFAYSLHMNACGFAYSLHMNACSL